MIKKTLEMIKGLFYTILYTLLTIGLIAGIIWVIITYWKLI